jgi:hypothetical protein
VLKRIGLFALGLLGVLSVFFVHSWYKDWRHRDEVARQALEVIRQEIAESSALASLGDINIDPTDVTLEKLNEVLQRPGHEISDRPKNSKSIAIGWACGGDFCTVRAFFLAPRSGQVTLSAVPVELWISNTSFGRPFVGSIGGIHLGDPTEKLLAICKQNGYTSHNRINRISWNKDWDVRWIAKDDKITSLFFFNMTLLNRAQAELRELERKP